MASASTLKYTACRRTGTTTRRYAAWCGNASPSRSWTPTKPSTSTRSGTSSTSASSSTGRSTDPAGRDRDPRLSIDYRLVHQRVHQPSVVPPDRAGRGREEHDDQLFLGRDPEIGAGGAGPRVVARIAHDPRRTGTGAHGHREPEIEAGLCRVGQLDVVLSAR